MIRRVQSLLSVLLVASATMLGGCVADAGSDNPSDNSVDALTDPGSEPAASEDASEPASSVTPEAPTVDARTVAVHDRSGWGSGDPQPIPWHETKTSGVGNDDEGTESGNVDPDRAPVPPSVTGPGDHR
jgi:hypothetical protein